MKDWFHFEGEAQLITPALLFYSERIDRNIAKMIKMAGAVDRLRPHVKTYKCKALVKRQMNAGIQRFKCATLAEAAMLLEMGVSDVLLAYPLVGPAQTAFRKLVQRFSGQLSVLVDHADQLLAWQEFPDVPIHCFIDLNVGMNRTGVRPEQADELLSLLTGNLIFRGWHVYDGHIHTADLQERKKEVDTAFRPVQDLLDRVGASYGGELVCGGSITFPIHTAYPERSLSPGTTVLWDNGYGSQFPDLDFAIAACLATRVVSKPGTDLLCLNLGYKAVAAEMSETPVYFPQLPEAKIINHSEEHLVLQTNEAKDYPIGSLMYTLPWHICPTVALHESAWLIEEDRIKDKVVIEARTRFY